jgi:hypothetical protein
MTLEHLFADRTARSTFREGQIMSIQCENCGGTLQVRGYEQELGDPKSRQWTMVCPICGEVHQYDSAWLRIHPAADTAPAPSAMKTEFGLNAPAMAG